MLTTSLIGLFFNVVNLIVLKFCFNSTNLSQVEADKKEIIRNDEDRLNRIQKQFQKEQPGNMHNSFV